VHVLWSILIDSHRHPAVLKLKLWRSSAMACTYLCGVQCERAAALLAPFSTISMVCLWWGYYSLAIAAAFAFQNRRKRGWKTQRLKKTR
jgi:hypothetical protein